MTKRPPGMRRREGSSRTGGARLIPSTRLPRRPGETRQDWPGRRQGSVASRRGHRSVRRGRFASPTVTFAALAAAVTFAVGAAARATADLPWLAIYLLGINAATFTLYAYDKRVAGGDRLRVPEAVLHTLALLGGTPAAVAAQRLLRHKTIKASFRRVGTAIVIVQAALLLAAFWYRDRLPP